MEINEAKYYDFDGNIKTIPFDKNNIMTIDKNCFLHTYNDKPARVFLGLAEFYYKNGILHRENNKPAIVTYNVKEKTINTEEFYVNGKHHRTNGPAEVNYFRHNGEPCIYYYFIRGIEIEKEDFDIMKNRIMMLEEV